MTTRIKAAEVFSSGDPAVDLRRIGEMLDGCGTSDRNALALIAFRALIEAGENTRPRIVGAAQRLGFKASHAGAVLGKSTGPGRSFCRGADGLYRLNAAMLAA